MGLIYKLRDEIEELYRAHGLVLVYIIRMATATLATYLIAQEIGTVNLLKNHLVIVAVGAMAGLLPIGLGIIVLMLYMLMHMVFISYVAAGISIVILATALVLSYLFSSREMYLVALAFVCSLLKGSFAIPLVLALVGSVFGFVPVLTGVVWYTIIEVVSNGKDVLAGEGITDSIISFIDAIAYDKKIILLLVTIGISYIICAIIKNTSIKESWKIGLFSAACTNVLLMALGGLVLSVNISYTSILIGTVLGVGIGLIIEVFAHDVEYRAARLVSFEDDEYVYYVKAVPKKTVELMEIMGNIENKKVEKPKETVK